MKKIISVLLSFSMIFSATAPCFAQENKYDNSNAIISKFGSTNEAKESEIANYITDEGIHVVLTAEGSLIRQYENGALVVDARPDVSGNKVISREYVNDKLDKTTSVDIETKATQAKTAQVKSSRGYSYKGTMYYTTQILQTQKNIKTYLNITYEPDQMYVVKSGTYKMASLVAAVAIGLSVPAKLAGAIIGALVGSAANVVLTKALEVQCDLWNYTWKGTSTPDTSYSNHYLYGTKAKVLSNGKTYTEGYTGTSDWKNDIVFQRLMYYYIYGIEVYPDYCK